MGEKRSLWQEMGGSKKEMRVNGGKWGYWEEMEFTGMVGVTSCHGALRVSFFI